MNQATPRRAGTEAELLTVEQEASNTEKWMIDMDQNPYQSPSSVDDDAGQTPQVTPEADTPDSYPGIKQAIVLLLLLILLQIGGGVVLGPFLAVADMAVLVGIANVLACSAVLTWGFRRAQRPFSEVFPLSSFPMVILVPLAVLVAGLQILLSEVDNLTRWLLPMPEWVAQMHTKVAAGGWSALVTLVVVAPLTEEPLCRGLILGGFRRRYSAQKAVLASAVLFAAVHLNPYQFASALVLGILLGWLFLRTGSLLPCIFVHALHNAGGWIAVGILGLDVPGFTSGLDDRLQFQPLWFDVLGLLLAGAGLWILIRVLGKDGDRQSNEGPYALPDEGRQATTD